MYLKFYTELMDTDKKTEIASIPGIFKIGLWLTFFNTWVLFEETIVDRYGLWAYLPYYRLGKLCAWDIGAAILLGVLVWRVFRRTKAPTVLDGGSAAT